jgi:hypothetical protein
MLSPHIAPSRPALIHGTQLETPQRFVLEMTTLGSLGLLARIRAALSRRWLGLDRLHLRFTQPIATAMRFAPARRLSPRSRGTAARSRRHHPGSLVQYAG